MPLALPDLQAAFAAHLAGEERGELIAAVVGDSIPAAARLRVYRHHVQHSLASALAATFPTVQALVGDDFFRALARAFVARTLPRQPVLAEYGAGFADFLADHEPARVLPYLADVARLDWALNTAFHAAPAPALTPAMLAAVEAERLPSLGLRLSDGVALVRSEFPIDRIWAASQPGASLEQVDVSSGGADLLVMRRPDDAAFVPLAAGEAAFVASLDAGNPLADSAEAGLRADPSFDLSTGFARLLALGVFAAPQQ